MGLLLKNNREGVKATLKSIFKKYKILKNTDNTFLKDLYPEIRGEDY